MDTAQNWVHGYLGDEHPTCSELASHFHGDVGWWVRPSQRLLPTQSGRLCRPSPWSTIERAVSPFWLCRDIIELDLGITSSDKINYRGIPNKYPPLVIQNLVNLLWSFIREISGSEFRPGHLLGQQPQFFIRKIPHKNINPPKFRAARAEFAPVIY